MTQAQLAARWMLLYLAPFRARRGFWPVTPDFMARVAERVVAGRCARKSVEAVLRIVAESA